MDQSKKPPDINTDEYAQTRMKIHWGRFAIWMILAIIAIFFLVRIYHTLLAFGLAFLIAYLLLPAVRFFSGLNIPLINKKIPWFVSIIIVYILLFALILSAGIVLIPMDIDQVKDIIRDTPVLVGKIQTSIDSIIKKYERLHISPQIEQRFNEFIDGSIAKMGNALGTIFKSIGNVLWAVFSSVLLIAFSMIIAMFVLVNINNMKVSLYSFIPPAYQDDIRDLLVEINSIFGSYVRGYSILCVVNGVLTYITLTIIIWILRLFFPDFPVFNYTLVVSVVAGATYFIPYLGCSLAVLVGMTLAFLQYPSLSYVFVIGLIALLTNQFVDRFITPKILGHALGVSTLFVVFAAFAGGELLGVWGMIVGIPAAVMIQSILRFVYKRFLAFPVSEEILAPVSAGPTRIQSKVQDTIPAAENGLIENSAKAIVERAENKENEVESQEDTSRRDID